MANLKGYQQLEARLHALGQGEPRMRRLGLGVVREAKLLVRRRTGNTGRSIHIQTVTANSVVVVAGGAAEFLEKGTRPHTITPRAAKALRWAASPAGRRLTGSPRKGAAVVFAKKVHHPGTKPQPFLLPGARKAAMGTGLIPQLIDDWNRAA